MGLGFVQEFAGSVGRLLTCQLDPDQNLISLPPDQGEKHLFVAVFRISVKGASDPLPLFQLPDLIDGGFGEGIIEAIPAVAIELSNCLDYGWQGLKGYLSFRQEGAAWLYLDEIVAVALGIGPDIGRRRVLRASASSRGDRWVARLRSSFRIRCRRRVLRCSLRWASFAAGLCGTVRHRLLDHATSKQERGDQ